MEQQIISDVPWVIVPIHPESVDPFIIWGDSMPIAPIIGREFVHGVTDCYSCIRDAFRLGRAKLAKQGVDWPFSPHLIKDFPRDLDWWSPQGDRPALDLYAANFSDAGFRPIAREEVRPGDVFLTKIRSDKLNHGGVVVGGGLILHHLPGRLSRREPAGSWQRVAELWLRCKATEKKYVAS
jgi:cell wall-associated NlpC family hydrolase